MEVKELDRLLASAELRNPKVFNASRERYLAEISFKAGEDKGYAHARQHCEDVIIPQAKVEGMKEVVEWAARELGVDWSEESEQLKKWGINEKVIHKQSK